MLNIYRASAGSGKTYRLTQDYIHLLFDPRRERVHRRILAVTFTNKATDEMKSRILKELHALAQGEKSDYRAGLMQKFSMSEDAVNVKARKILISILHDYSSFSISTIDRFFQQVIRSFAREIGVHGGYNLELDSDSTLQQSVDNLFLDLSKEENRQLLNWLTQFAEDRIENSDNWNPRKNIEELGHEIFKENYQHKAEDTNRKLHDREFLQAYRTQLRQIETDFEAKLKTTAQAGLDILQANGLTHADFAYSATKEYDKLVNGETKVGKRFQDMAQDVSKCYASKTPQHIKNAIESAYYGGLQQNMQDIVSILSEDIIYYNTASLILKHLNTLGILSDLAVQIKKLTEEQNSMLISDANMLLNRIIDNSDTPFVYEKTGVHIDHFMIDEFQDTSTLQWKNFFPLIDNSLSSDKFNLVVGDVKQSIYRWRNSDWKLLDEQIMTDFRPEQLHEENLDTNWRSDKNIIDFNNEFFRCAAQLLQQKLNENLDPALNVYPELGHFTEKIQHAYGHLYQKASPKAGTGYIHMSFIPADENEDGWKTESLNRLPALLEDIQQRGYKPGDVAILVKKNDEAQQVIQKILKYKSSPEAKPGYSYDIMGVEGIIVSNAPSVRFISGVLKLLLQPNDSIQQTIVNFEYARAVLHLPENQALAACFTQTGEDKMIFTASEKAELVRLRSLPLYDMIEKIISLFGVGSWTNEAVFVQAFQDMVYKYTNTRNSDVYSFLKWWDKFGVKQSMSTPDSTDAFRIMTIHKSKGLDFKVVIMPFCDWELDKKSGYFKNILWCEPKTEPYNALPLLPVEYSSKLGNSIFAADYFNEQMHQYIDNLNVAYVAFTRAKHELHCTMPKPVKTPESVDKISTIGNIMLWLYQSQTYPGGEIQLDNYYSAETGEFSIGNPLIPESKDENAGLSKQKATIFPSVSTSDRLHIRHQSLDFLLENQQLTDSRLNYGIIMHDVLRNIRYKSDQTKAIDALLMEGRINAEEKRFIEEKFEHFWEIPGVSDWFSADKKVLNEASILTPTGDIYRPDRVVISGNTAIVIDYKFGDTESDKYHRQVSRYLELIATMGYFAKGYLCYVSLEKLVEIQR